MYSICEEGKEGRSERAREGGKEWRERGREGAGKEGAREWEGGKEGGGKEGGGTERGKKGGCVLYPISPLSALMISGSYIGAIIAPCLPWYGGGQRITLIFFTSKRLFMRYTHIAYTDRHTHSNS